MIANHITQMKLQEIIEAAAKMLDENEGKTMFDFENDIRTSDGRLWYVRMDISRVEGEEFGPMHPGVSLI